MEQKVDAQKVIQALQQELSDKQLENAILKARLADYEKASQDKQDATADDTTKEAE